jgi:hypothetical protein
MATTTLNLPVVRGGVTLGTPVLTVKERTIDVVASIATANISLPAGRFLITTTVCSKPADYAMPTIVQTSDTTLASPGTATVVASGNYHAHKDFENSQAGSIIGMVDVKIWDGSGWRMYATSWTSESAASVAYSAVTSSTQTTQLLGANTHIFNANSSDHASTTTPLLDMMVDLGMDIVRTSTPWAFMENSTKGTTDAVFQSEVDIFMNACAARNLKVVVIFGGSSPTWAASGKPTSSMTTPWNSKTYTYALYNPTNQQDQADGLNRFLTRWGSQIYAIETMNEPNSTSYPDTVGNVVSTIQTIYNTVKASAFPSIKVVAPALAFNDTTYLQSMYSAGVKGYYDALSVHPYNIVFNPTFVNDPRIPWPEPNFYHGIAGIEDIRETQTANGDSAPLWITESGYSTSINSGFGISEQMQGNYLKYMFRQIARLPYVQAFTMHTMEDVSTDITNWNGNFGITYTDHATKKPAYSTVKSTVAGIKAGTL